MGIVTVVAGFTMLVAAGLLTIFFINQNETADRASNWFFLLFYALMTWAALDVHRFYVEAAGYTWVLTVVVVAALATLFILTVFVVSGRIPFERVAMVSTFGFVVLMLWMLGVSVLILTKGGLPETLGWLGVATMSLGVLVVGGLMTDRQLMTGEKMPGKGLTAVFILILAGLTTWIVWLGLAATSPV